MKIKKGDNVIITTGKDRGKTGSVVRAFPKSNRVLIEGVNVKKRHQRARKSGGKGQIVEKAAPVHVSNVMLIDPKSNKGTRVSVRHEDGKRLRVAKKSGAVIS